MAIRGIDAHIMVTKAAELTGDAARMLKAHEKAAEQAAIHTQRQAALDRKRTLASGKVRGTRITPDKEDGGDAYEPGQRRDKKQAPNPVPKVSKAPGGDKRRIDIVI